VLKAEYTVGMSKASPGPGTFTRCFTVHTIYMLSKLQNPVINFGKYFDFFFSLRNTKNIKHLCMRSKVNYYFFFKNGIFKT